jgi:hypothetical protein
MGRVQVMNAAWLFRKNVAKAAKQIYITNFAKYKIYLLPAGEEASTTFIVTGKIADAITLVGLDGAIIEIGMEVYTADSNGHYGIAGLVAGTYSGIAKMTGYIDNPVTIVVGTTPSVVNVLMNTLVLI